MTGLVAKIRTDQTVPVAFVRRFASDFLAGLAGPARDRTVLTTSVHANSSLRSMTFCLSACCRP